MTFLSQEKFSFISSALPGDAFGVVEFKGTEGLSRCYDFEITLVSDKADLDLDAVLASVAIFTIDRGDGEPVQFSGILTEFEQLQQVREYTFYRAFLSPKLWWLTQTRHNQVFLDKTVKEILTDVLEDGGLTSLDYEFRLEGDYSKTREFVCMYQESHFNFFSRWLEREGMYFFFEQGENGEKVVITDTKNAHTSMHQGKTLRYYPPSGLEGLHAEEVVHTFLCRQKRVPQSVLLKDYNYRRPSLDLLGQAEVAANGAGNVFIYGEHFQTPEEGDKLARIRAQELGCRQKLFVGETNISFIRPGYVFELKEHYRGDFNMEYLTIEVEHQGNQAAYLISGLKEVLSAREEKAHYSNTFSAIPARVQFRSEVKTPKPRFFGTLNAFIDASGTGKYAEIDDMGRYKIILPFDISGRKDGKASAWLRMAQPYAGNGHGMNFPLHKGTEVLLTFIEGNPDRPIIASAVANVTHPNVVSSKNATMSGFQSAGGNMIHMEDKDNNQRIVMKSGTKDTVFKLGRGSEIEEVVLGSDCITNVAKAGTSDFTTIANMFAFASKSTLCGDLAFQVLSKLINDIVKRIPDLAIDAVKDAADESQKIAELVIDAQYKDKLKDIQEVVAAIEYDLARRSTIDPKDKETFIAGLKKKQADLAAKQSDLPPHVKNMSDDLEKMIQALEKDPVDGQNFEENQKKWNLEKLELNKKSKELNETYDQTEKTWSRVSSSVSKVAGIIQTVAAPIYDLVYEKTLGNGIEKLLEKAVSQGSPGDIDANKYKGNYAYSVIHAANGASLVSQKSKYSGGTIFKLKPAPEGMLFFEAKGSQMHYAKQDFDAQGDRNVHLTATEKLKALSKKHWVDTDELKVVSEKVRFAPNEGLTIQTGWGQKTIVIPKVTKNNQFSREPEEGLHLIAGGDQNIKIKNDDVNNTGTVEIQSKKEVKVKVGKNTVTVGPNEIIIEAKSGKLSLKTKEATMELKTNTGSFKGMQSWTQTVGSNVFRQSANLGTSIKMGGAKVELDKTGNTKISGSDIKMNGQSFKIL